MTLQGGAIDSLSMTRGDRFPLEIRFISGGKFSSLPDGASGRVMLKQPGAYAADPLASASGWVKSGSAANAIYTFLLSLNTVPLNTLLTGYSVNLVLEVEWTYGDVIQTSLPVDVVVSQDYIRGNEGMTDPALDLKATEADALQGIDNTKYMTPLRVAQTLKAASAQQIALSIALG